MPSLLGFSMAQEEEENNLEAKFDAAVKVIWSLPEEGDLTYLKSCLDKSAAGSDMINGIGPFQPSDDMLLRFYGYYMQATQGPCNIPRPSSFWDSRGKVKWDAWSSLGNMTKVEAMKNYVQDIQLILETIPITDEVSDLVQKLDNFFMEVDNDDDEEEENDVKSRSFTRPFAQHADEQENQMHKPMMEGYGDLWDDIQNVQENDKGGSVHGVSVSSEEAEGSNEASELERKEECSGWKSEEEELGDEDDNTEDKDEDYKVWTPDQSLLMVADTRWRADTRGSSSSVEASVSSLTNGTHSSLNTEMEEDELAYSIERNVQCNTYMHLYNGYACEPLDIIPHKNQRSTDSDNEEFCDSMEQLAEEEGASTSKILSPGSRVQSVRQEDLWFDRSSARTGGEADVIMADSFFKDGINVCQLQNSLSSRGRASQSSRACSSLRCTNDDAPCCAAPSGRAAVANVNEQIAAALLRLQRDMSNVVHRLHALEAHASSQSRSSWRQESSLPVVKKLARPSWWPFDFCPLTVVLYGLWPLITHWGVQVYLKHKRRKIS